MADLTLQSFVETLDTTVRIAKHNGFRIGLAVGCIAMGIPLLAMIAAHVRLTERRDDLQRHDVIEATACHVELENRRTAESGFRTCVNGYHAVNTELTNLVRSCR